MTHCQFENRTIGQQPFDHLPDALPLSYHHRFCFFFWSKIWLALLWLSFKCLKPKISHRIVRKKNPFSHFFVVWVEFWPGDTAVRRLILCQARRPGGHSGAVPGMSACAPPNENCASPSEDCAPKKLQARGYWSANRGLRLPNSCFTASYFVIFVDSHQIS